MITGIPDFSALLNLALAEDIGAGDVTSLATIPAAAVAKADMVFRGSGVVCGLPLVEAAFKAVDPALEITFYAKDGDRVLSGARVLRVAGNARPILAAERTALNFIQRLSGVATETRKLVDVIADTKARLTDTRKTTPGWRALEKYAVRCGGGVNHRMGLYDAVLIKDNHVAVAGGVGLALAACRETPGKIEIEVDTLEQLREALGAGAKYILLDNMPPAVLKEAVAINAGRAELEASGGITPATIKAVAEAGVDVISVGWITHSVPALDIGLDIDL
ncbi:MAG: carboxylating nicotinate-nucleotide diphosphorylase [Proteobacteria bacterium]|nr:carboxylating nicotinate-nucleotide diphosphorylase [Pseudomonadota bacterium]